MKARNLVVAMLAALGASSASAALVNLNPDSVLSSARTRSTSPSA